MKEVVAADEAVASQAAAEADGIKKDARVGRYQVDGKTDVEGGH